MSTLSLVLIFIFGTLASNAMSRTLPEAAIVDKHEQWMARFGRVYEYQLEKERRLKIFKDNLEYIDNFNKEGHKTYKLGVNEFADYAHEEFLAAFTGYKNPDNPKQTTTTSSFRYESVTDVPTSLDWREQGAVTPVKNQQICKCSWAFLAVAAMEGITKIKTGPNHRRKLPYVAMQGSCATEKARSQAANISDYEDVPPNDEKALLKAVTNQPISVTVDANGRDFQYNGTSGVFNGHCGINLNHAVTIIGYGTNSEDGLKYWLIKNSWGEAWGENSYMRIQRDVDSPEGLCGLAMKATFPTID